jgi:diketogulonate reductase-like aldo/keto reductase
MPRAQVALAWVAGRPWVTAPIIGATKQHHIDDAVAALDLVLTDDEQSQLESAYETPRAGRLLTVGREPRAKGSLRGLSDAQAVPTGAAVDRGA